MKMKRSIDVQDKLRAIDSVKVQKKSITETAKAFKVDRKCIKDWIAKETQLRSAKQAGNGRRKRLSGGGRKKRPRKKNGRPKKS